MVVEVFENDSKVYEYDVKGISFENAIKNAKKTKDLHQEFFKNVKLRVVAKAKMSDWI